MTEENLPQEEEVKTTPPQESDSEEAGDLESLFADEEPEKESEEDKIKRLEDKLDRIQKGVSKYFSEKGRETKKVEVKDDSSDIEEMFFEQKPEAELVKEDLKTIAKAKGISILKAWREEKWLQDKAASITQAKAEEEKSKAKIDKPSSGTDFSKSIDQVKPEDVSKLTPPQKIEWLRKQADKERSQDV